LYSRCNKQYVEETGRSLRDRVTDHVSCIKLQKQTPIGLHFNHTGHSLKDFHIFAIEQFIENSESSRRTKESTWQGQIMTYSFYSFLSSFFFFLFFRISCLLYCCVVFLSWTNKRIIYYKLLIHGV